jgi:hypothetical protein
MQRHAFFSAALLPSILLVALGACSGGENANGAPDASGDATSSDPSIPTGDAASTEDANDGSISPDAADTGSPDSAVDSGDGGALDFCAADRARDLQCGYVPNGARCKRAHKCFETQFRAGVGPGMEQCIVNRPCNQPDDRCYDEAAIPFASDPAYVAYHDACAAKFGVCEDGGIPDTCNGQLALLLPATLDDLRTCFAQPCAAVRACLRAKLDATGCR